MVAFMPRLKDSGVGTIDSGRRLFEILDSDLKAETFRRGMPQEYANGAYLNQQGEKKRPMAFTSLPSAPWKAFIKAIWAAA